MDKPNSGIENKLVFSKGHAAICLYSALCTYGFIDDEELSTFSQDDSQLYGHVSHLAHPFIALSTGSLGHGLPFGIGLAIGMKKLSKSGRVAVVLSDGELNEGTTWESALIARKFRLDNLICVVDRNHLQSLDETEKTLPLEPLFSKWNSFGWDVTEINGHDMNELKNSLEPSRNPKIVIANTIKGKGVPWMENQIIWHYKCPAKDEAERALNNLRESYK
jgi:transketolase